MERLTTRTENGHAYLVNVKPDEQEVDSPYKNTLQCILDCFERLAVYEDTGLTPEEINGLTAERDAALRRAEAAEADLVMVAKLLMEHHKISMCEVCKGLVNPNDYCGHLCSMLKIESQFTWRGPEPGASVTKED